MAGKARWTPQWRYGGAFPPQAALERIRLRKHAALTNPALKKSRVRLPERIRKPQAIKWQQQCYCAQCTNTYTSPHGLWSEVLKRVVRATVHSN